MAARVKADWDAIEPQYSAGIRSLKDIGAEFGVSDAAIIKHARSFGWTRNLSAKIKAAADKKVSERMVSAEVSARKKLTENDLKEAVSNVQADRRSEQMGKATYHKEILEGMIKELAAQNEQTEALEKLGEIMADQDSSRDTLAEMYRKVISFSGRVDSGKKLIETWAKAVEVERKVYGIEEKSQITVNIPGSIPVHMQEVIEQ